MRSSNPDHGYEKSDGILTVVLLNSCSDPEQIRVDAIKILKVNQHPFLSDHERKLITVNKANQLIDELFIYPDSGAGCESYLFDGDDAYIMIDCNGQWIRIYKASGKLEKDGWRWGEKLPDSYLGRLRARKDSVYDFASGTLVHEKEVYRFKDPG